ncbi:MAG: hypothetical protein M3N31_08090 [Actinomycetota bacterium]|nr:hypothetical protein [Actinomycetota bacterium]
MSEQLLRVFVWQQAARAALRHRLVRDESGEGVISAAIAVLVMAFLGVLMWQLFKGTLSDANNNVNDQINQIGR